jgi:hypothetical protein
MPHSRLTYQTWLEVAGDDRIQHQLLPAAAPSPDLVEAVSAALLTLPENERELVRRFHFQGETLWQIARTSERSIYRVEAMHRRALARLRRQLAPFVRHRYRIAVPAARACPVCQSPDRPRIDALLSQRDEQDSWATTIARLRQEFGLVVRSPQTLKSHISYH